MPDRDQRRARPLGPFGQPAHPRASSTPGKQTLIPPDRVAAAAPRPAPGAPPPAAVHRSIQALFGGGRARPTGAAEIQASAQRGIATPSSPLPHRDAIQRAFGRHDISGIQAHVGEAAAASAGAIGARAYATGSHVVAGASPDLFTMAHEAAHVVQQRGGVQLSGGVGAANDAHERHADAVAERVVRGESAEGLLDEYSAGRAPGAAGSGAAVQRKLGFEFETGITVSQAGQVLTKKTQIGTQSHAGWKVEADDDGRMEFIVDPPLEITADLATRLGAIFDVIEPYCARLEHAASAHRTLVVDEDEVMQEDPDLEDGFLRVEGDDVDSGSESEPEPEYSYATFPLSEATLRDADNTFMVAPQVPIRANPQITAGLTLAQVARLPDHNRDRRLPGGFGATMPASPETYGPKVTVQRLGACGVDLGAIHNQISDELKGLLTLVASYLIGGCAEFVEYPKKVSDSFLLARTDFATLFRMAPEWRYFTRHPDVFERVALSVAGLSDAAGPVYTHGILVDAQVNLDRVPFGPTRTAWLRGMAAGTDIMTQLHDPAFESMGEKGSKQEQVAGSDGRTFSNGGIFEMRGGQTTSVSYRDWRAFAHDAGAFLQTMQKDPLGQLGQMQQHTRMRDLLASRNK